MGCSFFDRELVAPPLLSTAIASPLMILTFDDPRGEQRMRQVGWERGSAVCRSTCPRWRCTGGGSPTNVPFVVATHTLSYCHQCSCCCCLIENRVWPSARQSVSIGLPSPNNAHQFTQSVES